MKLGRVTGTVVSTIKYDRYVGIKLLKVRHLDLSLMEVGEEMVALDAANAGIGDVVLLNNDGGAAQLILQDPKLIASITICGIVDSFTHKGNTVRCHR